MTRWPLISLCLIAQVGCSQRISLVKPDGGASRNCPVRSAANTVAPDSAYSDLINDGLMSLRQGELTSACRQFERAIEIESTGWQAHYYLGLVLGRQERYEESLESLHSGLAFAPQDKRVRSRIYLALAECWENQRKYRHAELNYITALNLDPDSSPAADGVARMRNFEHQPGR